MRIACVSASNVRHAGERSTSLTVCRLLDELVRRREPTAEVEVVRLVDHDLRPCIGCGRCLAAGKCAVDPAFNAVYGRLVAADELFVVAAHYAPIPAKLAMLLEKVEQLAFLPRFRDEAHRSPLYRKPVGIVAHGGGTEEVTRHYKALVLDPVANAFGWPVEAVVVGAGDEWPTGVVFPVAQVSRAPDSPFPVQEHDWADIERRIDPLVASLLGRVIGWRTG